MAAIVDDTSNGNAAEAHTVITAFATDQPGSGSVPPGAVIGKRHLQCRVDGFRPGSGEEDMVEAFRRNRLQTFCKFEGNRMAHLEGGRVVQFGQLPGDRIGDLFITVSGIAAPEARSAVENAAAVVAAVMHALGRDQHAWRLFELPVRGKRHPVSVKRLVGSVICVVVDDVHVRLLGRSH